MSQPIKKQDGTPVTIADFASQAIICRAIKKAFPSDPIVAEEDARALQDPAHFGLLEEITSYLGGLLDDATPDSVISWIDQGRGNMGRRYWTLDPIDGTKGFIRGDQYAIAIALFVTNVHPQKRQ